MGKTAGASNKSSGAAAYHVGVCSGEFACSVLFDVLWGGVIQVCVAVQIVSYITSKPVSQMNLWQ